MEGRRVGRSGGYDTNTGKELIFVSERYFRPAEFKNY